MPANPAADRPTLDQIRTWPATVDVEQAALALGVSRSTLYKAIADDTVNVQVTTVSHRLKVITASLVALLDGQPRQDGAAA
ncbi:MAG TPA: hypothetical protein VME19_17800 [Streptosporangiaceae bacterium]|nr:hypothetical protein [Streptosporangiaceae bacterium]